MKVQVAWLGRPSASPFEGQVERYRKHVCRRWQAEDRPIKPASGGRERDPARALGLEARALERIREPGWRIVALDERGEVRTSEAFAGWMKALEERATPGVAFAVGSDLGLARDFVARTDETLSLSALTLPHLLARLLLWEQLYRATQILGGGAYHRNCVQ